MSFILKMMVVAAVGVAMLGVAAVGALVTPIRVHGQTVRDRPLSQSFRAQILGGADIGVHLRDVDEADVSREKLPAQVGAVVDEIQRDSPAAEAGFRSGDVVTAYDGEKIRSARHLARLIEESPDGRKVPVTVVRGGQTLTLTVTPEARPGIPGLAGLRRGDFTFAWPDAFRDVPGWSSRRLDPAPDLERRFPTPSDEVRRVRRPTIGITLQATSGQLAEFFGAPDGGVLITRVEPGSPAADAGLKAGDVIVKVGSRAVRSADEVITRVRADDELTLTVVREKKEQTVVVKR